MSKEKPSGSILGSGFSFPVRLDLFGGFQFSSGEQSVEESIHIILSTTPGERVMRPDFGCEANELLFSPNNSRTQALIAHYIEQALIRWEPRIILKEVKAEADSDCYHR